MGQLNYGEVMERVQYYENDAGLKELHARAKNSWQALFQMTHRAQLPDHLTRGVTIGMPSPRLRDLRSSLVADMASYKSIVTVHPFTDRGAPSGELKGKADSVEKWLSILRGEWNDGGKLRADMLHQMLVGPYFVSILSCGDLAEDAENPWQVLRPDPVSCFFPVSGSPDRPKMFARRYKQIVREMEAKYSGRPRTEHYDAKLKRRNGVWRWEPLADDVARDDSMGTIPGGDAKYGEECEFVWFDDGEYIYHIALNQDEKSGEVVWCGKNLTGGCSALVVCGDPTPIRETQQRLNPALLPVMQTVLNRNLVRSLRATKALNAKPDMVIEMTPEAFAQAQDMGLATQVQMAEGVPNMIMVEGKAVPWVLTNDVDLDKLDESWANEEAEYVAAWKEPTDPDTVSDARANTYLTAVEAIRRRQTPLLKDGDWLETQLCKMVLHSLKEYGREFTLHAKTATALSSGEIKAGGGATLGPADLDFDYEVAVTTRAQTESEQRAREEHGMQRVAWGTGTLEEVVEVAYIDSTEQLKKLAIDAGYRLQKPTMLTYLDAAWRDKVKTRAGIMLPDPMQPMVEEAPDVGGQSPMQPAAVNQAVGGPY